MRNTSTTPTALHLAKQHKQEQKERGEKTELQTTPNEEGKTLLALKRNFHAHSKLAACAPKNPLEAIKRTPGPCNLLHANDSHSVAKGELTTIN
jgi:hypothetical protein